MHELEAELLGELAHRAVGEGAAAVANREHRLLGERVDLGEVVVLLAHDLAQLGVGAPRLLGRRDRLGRAPAQLALQPDERLEHVVADGLRRPHPRQPERRVDGAALHALQLDLEGGAVVRRLLVEQVADLHAEGARDEGEVRELRLALAVLDEAQLAAGHADGDTELLEGEAGARAEVADALTEGHKVLHS